MQLLILFQFLLMTTFCLAAPDSSTKIQGFLINADNMDRDTVNETIDLSGHVQVVNKDEHLSANKVKINTRSKKIDLTGNVKIVSAANTIGGDQVILDYENNTGIIYNGYVQSGSVIFEGTLLQKIGQNEYYVTQGNYTACTNCPASWSFSGSSIRAELGGYAYVKNSFLRIGSVPVLWLPYLIVPLKSDRQSGLLTPELESSVSGGLAISQSMFWAISKSTDATFTLKNYELRGLKALTEYRYALNSDSNGQLTTGYLSDRVFKNDTRLDTFRTDKGSTINRWFLKYDHYQTLPDGWVHRMQINNASDLQYSKDFPLETKNYGDSSMENRVSFSKNTKDQHYSFDSSYYINLLQSNPKGSNSDAVHRVPEFRFSQIPKNIGDSDWIYSFDFDYTNFARSSSAYDNLTLYNNGTSNIRFPTNSCGNQPNYDRDPTCYRVDDGQYDSSQDLIRTGQRFDFKPSIYRPITIANAFDLVPKITYREIHYNFPIGNERNLIRRYIRTELSGRTTYSRIFNESDDVHATMYKHEIQPEITMTAVPPWIQNRNHPFFGFNNQNETPYYTTNNVNDDDLSGNFGLQFDYNDRIYDRKLVTYGVTNKLIQKKWNGSASEYKQIALFRIAQSYDAYQDEQNDKNKQAWSDISGLLDVRLDHITTVANINYFPYQKVTNTSSRVRLTNDANQFVQFDLTKQYPIVLGQDANSDKRVENYGFAAGFISPYINLMGRFIYDANQPSPDKRIKSWTYITQLKPPGDCWQVSIINDQVTAGDTTLKVTFEFTFDGKPRPPLPPETLDSFGF